MSGHPDDRDDETGEDAGPAPASEGFALADLLSHLLRRAHFDAEAAFAEHYAGLDVTSRQLALLYAIHRDPGAQQAVLAASIGLDVNTCSDLAKRIERKGLIRRERSTADRRAFGLFLTPAGEAMIAHTAPLTMPYQRAIASRLTDRERGHMLQLLRRMLGLEETSAKS